MTDIDGIMTDEEFLDTTNDTTLENKLKRRDDRITMLNDLQNKRMDKLEKHVVKLHVIIGFTLALFGSTMFAYGYTKLYKQ